MTLPARRPTDARREPASQVERELVDIFTEMGFEVAEGPEIEEDFYNFEALNFPPDHPARDMQDTFTMASTDGAGCCARTPRRSRSARCSYEPPVRIVIAPGRVYRCDSRRDPQPGLPPDRGAAGRRGRDLREPQGHAAALRRALLRPGDPGALPSELLSRSPSRAPRSISGVSSAKAGCRVCSQTGWLEILGCGMVDPNVFEASASTPTATPATPSAWGSSASGCSSWADRRHPRALRERRALFARQFD